MFKNAFTTFGLLSIGLCAEVRADSHTMYVSGDSLNVRYCASTDCCIANRLGFNAPVSIQEKRGNWVRISGFYDISLEGAACQKPGPYQAAHWVAYDFLSHQPQRDTAFYGSGQNTGGPDPRIRGIPRVGDYGLTQSDLQVIMDYASLLLNKGICNGIDAGNKSVSREGTYYVACSGEYGQRYFTVEDVAG